MQMLLRSGGEVGKPARLNSARKNLADKAEKPFLPGGAEKSNQENRKAKTAWRLLTFMRSHSAKWERLREIDPALHLVPLKDDLEWFFAGEPDGNISVEFFILCSDENNAADTGLHLLKFFKDHPFVFMCSGWVKPVIGRLALEDGDATRKFLKAYWSKGRTSTSKTQAYRALKWVDGVHRSHWLKASSWMQRFHRGSHPSKENDALLIDRALVKYVKRTDYTECKCLPAKYLNVIGLIALGHPDDPRSVLADEALARCFGTSSSTLTHVRASIKKIKKKKPLA
jgi:hypothetical protein